MEPNFSLSEWTFPVRSGSASRISKAVRDIYIEACCAVGDDLEHFLENARFVPIRWTLQDSRPQSDGLLIGLDASDSMAASDEPSGYRFGFPLQTELEEAKLAVAESTQDWLADLGVRWPYRQGHYLRPVLHSGKSVWAERESRAKVAGIGVLHKLSK